MGSSTRRRVTVVLAAALGLGVLAAPARGRTDDGAAFANGASKAVANLAKAAPGVGSLELGAYVGVAISEVKNDLAQAQAQAIDLGLIGIALTIAGCDGSAYAKPEDLPQPTRVDNRGGDASASRDQFPLGAPGFGAGRMEARATRQPSAEAVSTGGAVQIGPAVSINGGQARAVTRVVDSRAREAHAMVEASVDLGGVVRLGGLRWDALHRTGADPAATGRFDVASASVLGVPVPVEQLTPLQDAINAALAPTGISIQLPRVERLNEEADLVRVTPLRILLKDSEVGATALGPALDLTRTGRSDLYDRIVAVDCQLGSLLLVGDVALSVLSGTGFLVIDVGGAEAGTAENRFQSPFGAGTRPPAGLAPALVDAAGATAGTGSTSTGPGTRGDGATQEVATRVASESRCESSHPFRWPPCSQGAAVPLGVLAVLATAGVALLDWRHQRRRATTT